MAHMFGTSRRRPGMELASPARSKLDEVGLKGSQVQGFWGFRVLGVLGFLGF